MFLGGCSGNTRSDKFLRLFALLRVTAVLCALYFYIQVNLRFRENYKGLLLMLSCLGVVVRPASISLMDGGSLSSLLKIPSLDLFYSGLSSTVSYLLSELVIIIHIRSIPVGIVHGKHIPNDLKKKKTNCLRLSTSF